MTPIDSLNRLSDEDLLVSLRRAAGRAREATAELLAHLAEADVRRLYLGAACASMFAYLTERLGFDEGAAYKRIAVARLARRFPVVLDLVASGALHLTGAALLAPHLTDANHRELLAAASGRSKREIVALLADRAPKPDVTTRISRVRDLGGDRGAGGRELTLTWTPAGAAAPSGPPEEVARAGSEAPPGVGSAGSGSAAQRPSAQPDPAPLHQAVAPTSAVSETTAAPPAQPEQALRLTPLGAQRYRLQLTASAELVAKLHKAQALLGHAIADGDLAEVLDRALTLLCDRLVRRRFGAPKKADAGGMPVVSGASARETTAEAAGPVRTGTAPPPSVGASADANAAEGITPARAPASMGGAESPSAAPAGGPSSSILQVEAVPGDSPGASTGAPQRNVSTTLRLHDVEFREGRRCASRPC